MQNVLAILLAGGAGERLYPLTRDTAKPAVPFGGAYRIIDFTLSNCINSDVRRILILTQYKSLDLIRHIRDGWNILSPELGEYVEVIPPMKRVHADWYQGTADAVLLVLHEDAQDSNSTNDFGKDVIPRHLEDCRVIAYDFRDMNAKQSRYWRDVGTLDAYYEANMDLVSVTPEFNLYDHRWPIRTKATQQPPAKFVFAQKGRRMGLALDSVVSAGCIVSGGRVVHSVLSPGA